MAIVQRLDRQLPANFSAEPRVHLGASPPPIYAATCRWRPVGRKSQLDAWSHPLVVGKPLPTLPLWLTPDLAIALELEASYEDTCKALRIG